MACEFCDILANQRQKIITENELFFSFFDKYPLNQGHILVVPKRHFSNFFDMTPQEWSMARDMIFEIKEILDIRFSPTGYNIGVNVGADAGQSIFHTHIHIIPRYNGDIENPGPEDRKVNMPLFEFMRDNDLFKKIIYSQIVQKKLESVIQKSDKNSLEEIKGDDEYLHLLKKRLKKAVDEFCEKHDGQSYDNIIELLELISIVKG
jgi:diadenosine tetraphosphate (Ap4A) HIT family hydrolase